MAIKHYISANYKPSAGIKGLTLVITVKELWYDTVDSLIVVLELRQDKCTHSILNKYH